MISATKFMEERLKKSSQLRNIYMESIDILGDIGEIQILRTQRFPTKLASNLCSK